MIRSAQKNRWIAWLALAAIGLVAVMPTVSQLRAAEQGHDLHLAGDMGSMPASGHDHHHPRGAPDDCWKKCGYCGFLSHTPSVGGIEYVAAFAPAGLAATAVREHAQRAHATYAQAAQPRGPPLAA